VHPGILNPEGFVLQEGITVTWVKIEATVKIVTSRKAEAKTAD
jgi:hypothetical protein